MDVEICDGRGVLMPYEDSSRGVVSPNHGHCSVASWTLQSPPGDDLKVRAVAPNQVLRNGLPYSQSRVPGHAPSLSNHRCVGVDKFRRYQILFLGARPIDPCAYTPFL